MWLVVASILQFIVKLCSPSDVTILKVTCKMYCIMSYALFKKQSFIYYHQFFQIWYIEHLITGRHVDYPLQFLLITDGLRPWTILETCSDKGAGMVPILPSCILNINLY